MSSWRRNRALFDSLRPRRETEKRSLRSLRYRNGISQISGDSLSRVTQGKQRNAIVVTQTIPLARIVLSIGEAYSWNKWISPSITRNASIAGILLLYVLHQIHQSFCTWPWIPSGKGCSNVFHFYMLLRSSFNCNKKLWLWARFQFYSRRKCKAGDKTSHAKNFGEFELKQQNLKCNIKVGSNWK